ncbi:protein kinase [Whalleya microplaca]|nr:protein kinase [Whalleya microplaca]
MVGMRDGWYEGWLTYVYPHGIGVISNRASKAIELSSHYVPPRLQPIEHQYGRCERGSTEPPENLGASALDSLPCLVVRCSDIPRTDRGLIFGSNKRCDVVVAIQRISSVHFSLTFDKFNRPIVKDIGSLVGTKVTYNGEGEGTRSDFQWIVGGHFIPQEKESIIITVPDTISFQIVVPYHDISCPAYVDRANRFCQGAAAAEELFGDLGISNPRTRVATGAHTAGEGPIYLRKKLGEGGFGTVTHCWNVSTGDEFALKEPFAKAIRKRTFNADAWGNEARILGKLDHPNIVKLVSFFGEPHPQLHLEYIPGGSLDELENIAVYEAQSILAQCLLALTYLHGRQLPIVHRDIKPSNILVQHRFLGGIDVKFGDFGLAKDSRDMLTLCGTQKYLAPEIYSNSPSSRQQQQKYTPAIDIWSLGIVTYRLLCGLPRYKKEYEDNGTSWCQEVVHELKKLLLCGMLVMSPDSRWSAEKCYKYVEELTTEDGCRTPTPAPYADGPGPVAADDSPFTIDSSRYIKSIPAPPKSALQAATTGRKRRAAAKTSSSSSSARRHDKRREGRNSLRHTISSQQPEMAQFKGYSQDPLNSLFVGSSLAEWQPAEVQSGMETEAEAEVNSTSPRDISGVPRNPGDWPLTNGDAGVGTGDPNHPGNLCTDDEMFKAAALLQAMGQDATD